MLLVQTFLHTLSPSGRILLSALSSRQSRRVKTRGVGSGEGAVTRKTMTMQCLRVLHTDAGIGIHGSGRYGGRSRRRDRGWWMFVGEEEWEKSLDAWEGLEVCSRRLGLWRSGRMGIIRGRQKPTSRATRADFFDRRRRRPSFTPEPEPEPRILLLGVNPNTRPFTSLVGFIYVTSAR
jgi:hypothetical protein